MSIKTIVFLLADLLIATVLIILVFKSFKEFLRSIYYLFYPDIASIVKDDYDNDFSYTHKLLFVLFVLFLIVFVELKLFY
jgi:hypothetical protein